MSLATRCPHCGTVFKLVPDQLRVHGGWVRCGHCDAPFDAQSTLVDPLAWPLAQSPAPLDAPPRVEAPEAPEAPKPPEAPEAPPAPESPLNPLSPVSVFIQPAEDAPPPAPAPQADREPAPRPVSRPVAPLPWAHPAPPPMAIPRERPGRATPQAAQEDEAPMPSFMAPVPRRATVWTVIYAGVLLLGSLALAAQWVYWNRHRLAAQHPTWQPALLLACETLNCRLLPPAELAPLQVLNSRLTRVTDRPHDTLLEVTLHNSAPYALRPPALRLTLTDAMGTPKAQRVLWPEELEHPPQALAAQSDFVMAAVLQTPGLQVVGFTVEVFFP